jgi:NTP pyrophosphatase (non-canonical NTP hydrolase)
MKTVKELQPLIIEWANEKGIDCPKSQRLKTYEEVGETAKAILQNDMDEIKDGIGDIAVTVIILYAMYGYPLETSMSDTEEEDLSEFMWLFEQRNTDVLPVLNTLAATYNTTLEECLNIAWNEIKGRTGKTVNGTFIKDS